MSDMVVDDTHVLINVRTGRYPMSLDDVREEVVQMSLPLRPSIAKLVRLGYEVVRRQAKPENIDMVESDPIRDENGTYWQQWRSPTEE